MSNPWRFYCAYSIYQHIINYPWLRHCDLAHAFTLYIWRLYLHQVNPDNKRLIAQSDGIPALIKLLGTSILPVKIEVVAALANLAVNGVYLCVSLLCSRRCAEGWRVLLFLLFLVVTVMWHLGYIVLSFLSICVCSVYVLLNIPNSLAMCALWQTRTRLRSCDRLG